MDPILTNGRAIISGAVTVRLQSYLDRYDTGMTIVNAELKETTPPAAVKDAFDDVQRAKNDKGKRTKKAENKPLTDIKHSWATLVKEAQVDGFRFHDLRHDFASRLVQAGIPLDQVRDLLGHSSVTLTERYAHLAPHLRKAAVEMLV